MIFVFLLFLSGFKLENMKKYNRLAWWCLCMVFASCTHHYTLSGVSGGRMEVTAVWDVAPDSMAMRVVAPYQATVDSIMSPVLGESAVAMTVDRPESPLSNYVADVLRNASERLGRKADIGLCNMGGLRSTMPKGKVTYGDVLEISPFENHLCLLVLSGEKLLELMRQIAAVGGEGLSGARLVINQNGELLSAQVGGKPIDKHRKYTVATIDYLAEGNDRMYALKDHEKIFTTQLTLRGLIMDAIRHEYSQGRQINAAIEGRIVIK